MKSQIRRRNIASIVDYNWLNSGGGGSKIPTDLPGLQFWYDISQLTPQADGTDILSVPDLSGLGKTLTPLSAARRPVYETNELNGKPIARFTLNDNLRAVSKADFDFTHTGDSTLFFIVKPDTQASSGVLFSNLTSNSPAQVGRYITTTSSGLLIDNIYAGTSGQNVCSTSVTLTKGGWYIVVITYKQGEPDDDEKIYINGLFAGSSQGTLTPSASTSDSLPCFGSLYGGTLGFVGDMAEWFGYNRALSIDEINSLVGGLTIGS